MGGGEEKEKEIHAVDSCTRAEFPLLSLRFNHWLEETGMFQE